MRQSTSRYPPSDSSNTSSLDSDVASSEDEKFPNPSRPTGQSRRNIVYHSLPVDGGGPQRSRQPLVEDSQKTSTPNSTSYPEQRKSRTRVVVLVCVVVALLLVGGAGVAYYFRDRLFGGGAATSEASSPVSSIDGGKSSVGSVMDDSSSTALQEEETIASPATTTSGATSLESSVTLSTSTVSHDSTKLTETPSASSSSILASPSASSMIDPSQSYTLANECIGDTFFNCFTSSSTLDAINSGLASVDGTSAYLRLNSWVDLEDGEDRPMIHLESEISFENALLVLDVPKVPFGCGTGSMLAFGREDSTGLSLPLLDASAGQSSVNLFSNEPGCSLGSKELFTGNIVDENIDCILKDTDGCTVLNPSTYSYARPWNEGNGGVFAFLFDKSGIFVWQFSRAALPPQLDPPQPAKWGLPLAAWPASTCPRDILPDQALKILLEACSADSTWEKTSWSESQSCTKAAPTCGEFVRKGENVADMVWQFDSLRIYETD